MKITHETNAKTCAACAGTRPTVTLKFYGKDDAYSTSRIRCASCLNQKETWDRIDNDCWDIGWGR